MTTEKDRAPQSTEAARLQSEVGPHARHLLVHFRIFEQLKQRNVFRVGALYLVVCWLILDPVHVVFHMLDVPIWADRLVVMLMAAGFPAALIFAWVFEITPEAGVTSSGPSLSLNADATMTARTNTGRRARSCRTKPRAYREAPAGAQPCRHRRHRYIPRRIRPQRRSAE
jgi:hypothetical protein